MNGKENDGVGEQKQINLTSRGAEHVLTRGMSRAAKEPKEQVSQTRGEKTAYGRFKKVTHRTTAS